MELDGLRAALDEATSAHLRAWWRAATGGGGLPRAPALLGAEKTRRVLKNALAVPDLAAEARPWWRLALACGLEEDPEVAAVRSEAPSWAGLERLGRARGAAARRMGFDGGVLEVLAQAVIGDRGGASPGLSPAWHEGEQGARPSQAGHGAMAGVGCDQPSITRAATVLFADLGVALPTQITLGADDRTFVIVPGRDVRVVTRGGHRVADWWRALHELGHGAVGMIGTLPPRAMDEAVATWTGDRLCDAAWVTRALEVAPARAEAIASEASDARRSRRIWISALADLEVSLYRGEPIDPRRLAAVAASLGGTAAWSTPPRSLWADPGAQLAYHRAEELALGLDAHLRAGGALPGPATD